MKSKPSYEELLDTVQKLELLNTLHTKSQEIAGLGHFSYDPLTNTMEGAPELFRIFDVDPKTPLFEALSEAVHPDDKHLILSRIDSALKGDAYDIEHRVMHKNGDVLYVHSKGELIETSQGKRLIGVVTDVTDHKRIEKAFSRIEWMLTRLSQD